MSNKRIDNRHGEITHVKIAQRDLPMDYTTIYPRMSHEESSIAAVDFICDNIVSRYDYTEIPLGKFDWRVFTKIKT